MNVFEDLVGELKEQNLLEETFIETSLAPPAAALPSPSSAPSAKSVEAPRVQVETRPTPELPAAAASAAVVDFGLVDAAPEKTASAASSSSAADFDFFPVSSNSSISNTSASDTSAASSSAVAASVMFETDFGGALSPVNEMEFYRRRAVDEVTSLQLVEHVFSGVEREQMRILPKPFNDISVKKALHDFLQISKASPASENAQAEFRLMQETESWCSALSHRDRHLSVSALRRYCETTKPSLSPQALVALARFYRNLPHAEAVRSKFDMVVTRLFTKDTARSRREIVFSREELVTQIEELYADWASVALYSVEDETELLLLTVKFDDFLVEALDAENFDELVKNDFYNRLRLFKESIGDKFYAPVVLAAAIENNVHIGNRYVELLEKERVAKSAEEIESQYSFLLDQAISDATSKTLQLVELLRERATKGDGLPVDKTRETLRVPENKVEYKATEAAGRRGLLGISWWLVASFCAVILLSAGLFVYVEYFNPQPISTKVQKVNLENSVFKDYLVAARINEQTFVGVVAANWADMSAEKKQEILGNLLTVGREKGFAKVLLLDQEGITVGHASESEIIVSK